MTVVRIAIDGVMDDEPARDIDDVLALKREENCQDGRIREKRQGRSGLTNAAEPTS
ncbi:MAG TPA: hypothetical protein VKS60_17305 [Stellaceae bacterium]|nr:hypothetical protein [Stellaceae bacterium]